ncbi:MAG: aryl-sulfate sulfotransferase [Planctomycetota bacterium]|nr:aryl-sulfate sulfotransferase [Planctomycetota bacterium]
MKRLLRRELTLLVLALAACDRGEPSPARSQPRSDEPDLQSLAALGYVAWDENARGELAGVVRHDPARAFAGLNLYANDSNEAYALDMDGRVVATWTVPGYDQCEFFRLLDGGRILIESVDQGIALLDAGSNVVWRLDMNAHHDVAALEDGTFLVPYWDQHADYRGRPVRFDGLLHVSAEGGTLGRWSTFDHLEELQALHPPLALDTAPPPGPDEAEQVYDYYHLNTVSPIGPNALDGDPRFQVENLLLCFRNANLLVILDRETRQIVWHWRPGTIDFPHMPTMLPDGRMLLFDNGHHRGWSRILEFDPRDGEIVWRYQAEPRESFFTEGRGSVQRLPNGNTLICESERGRAFEVTRAGEIVWEFWNPELKGGRRKRIYRLLRIVGDRADELRAAFR